MIIISLYGQGLLLLVPSQENELQDGWVVMVLTHCTLYQQRCAAVDYEFNS